IRAASQFLQSVQVPLSQWHRRPRWRRISVAAAVALAWPWSSCLIRTTDRPDIRMSRIASVLGSLVFLVVAPGTLAVLVPWWLTRWRLEPPLLGWIWLRGFGALIIPLALPVLLESFARFALEGRGTPAPIAPPERLVVRGFYRYVRNPMYVAVTSLILGQGLLLGSAVLIRYGLLVLLGFHLFVLGYEEPLLQRQFGTEYAVYRARVRRWLPRLRPWNRPEPPASRVY